MQDSLAVIFKCVFGCRIHCQSFLTVCVWMQDSLAVILTVCVVGCRIHCSNSLCVWMQDSLAIILNCFDAGFIDNHFGGCRVKYVTVNKKVERRERRREVRHWSINSINLFVSNLPPTLWKLDILIWSKLVSYSWMAAKCEILNSMSLQEKRYCLILFFRKHWH